MKKQIRFGFWKLKSYPYLLSGEVIEDLGEGYYEIFAHGKQKVDFILTGETGHIFDMRLRTMRKNKNEEIERIQTCYERVALGLLEEVEYRAQLQGNAELTLEKVAQQLCDGLEYDVYAVVAGLKQYMNEHGLTLKELNDLCWEDSVKIFDAIM